MRHINYLRIVFLLVASPAWLWAQSREEAMKLFGSKDYRTAAEVFKAVVTGYDSKPEDYVYLLNSYLHSNNGAAALEWSNRALNRYTNHAQFIALRGRAHYLNCNIGSAIADALASASLNGNDTVYYDLAYYYSHTDSHRLAIEAANKISASSDYAFAAHNIKGIAKSELGDNRGAKKEFREALLRCRNEQDKALLYCNMGKVEYYKGNKNTAIDFYAKAIKADSTFPKGYINRGYVKREAGFYNEAQADFQKAIELLKTNCTTCGDYCEWQNHFYLGVAYGHMEDFENSAISFDKAIALRPCEGEIYYFRGWTKGLALGFIASCSDWQKAEELGYKYARKYREEHCK